MIYRETKRREPEVQLVFFQSMDLNSMLFACGGFVLVPWLLTGMLHNFSEKVCESSCIQLGDSVLVPSFRMFI
jgi:hypothetical protein